MMPWKCELNRAVIIFIFGVMGHLLLCLVCVLAFVLDTQGMQMKQHASFILHNVFGGFALNLTDVGLNNKF